MSHSKLHKKLRTKYYKNVQHQPLPQIHTQPKSPSLIQTIDPAALLRRYQAFGATLGPPIKKIILPQPSAPLPNPPYEKNYVPCHTLPQIVKHDTNMCFIPEDHPKPDRRNPRNDPKFWDLETRQKDYDARMASASTVSRPKRTVRFTTFGEDRSGDMTGKYLDDWVWVEECVEWPMGWMDGGRSWAQVVRDPAPPQ